jgi:hypothetical protein
MLLYCVFPSTLYSEQIMAKKTSKKAPVAKATKKAAGAKAKKKAAPKKAEHFEIELDPAETKAFELAHGSDKVRKDLEEAATVAMAAAVRKVFKRHGVSLTESQSQTVMALLFCD